MTSMPWSWAEPSLDCSLSLLIPNCLLLVLKQTTNRNLKSICSLNKGQVVLHCFDGLSSTETLTLMLPASLEFVEYGLVFWTQIKLGPGLKSMLNGAFRLK
jgi:hypothetical protein